MCAAHIFCAPHENPGSAPVSLTFHSLLEELWKFLISHHHFLQVLDLQKALENITADYKGKIVTLTDICNKPLAPVVDYCLIQSVFQWWVLASETPGTVYRELPFLVLFFSTVLFDIGTNSVQRICLMHACHKHMTLRLFHWKWIVKLLKL